MAEAGELEGELSNNISSEDSEMLNSADTSVESAAESGIESEAISAKANLEKAQQPILEGIGKSINIGEPITEATVADASLENPETEAGKTLKKNFIEPAIDKANESVKNAQENNGEGGKALKDSPKTMRELLEKYGPAGLKLLLALGAIGFGIYELDKVAAEMSGCYKFSTTVAGSQTKIGCSESTCSCNKISQCGSNNILCTQANGLQYIWRKFTALDALCQLPKMVIDPIASSLSDLWKPVKEILIGLVIVLVVLGILYIIFKIIEKKLSHH